MTNTQPANGPLPSATAEAEAILQARARELAQPMTQAAPVERLEIVTFMLAYETYAIPAAYVREVYPLHDITPIPGTPPFVAGVINAHGRVLSVIDLKQFFELPAKGITDLNKVIVLSDGHMEFGILADTILDVRTIPVNSIQSSLPTLTGIREHYLFGISTEHLVILDAQSLLVDNSIVVHEEIN